MSHQPVVTRHPAKILKELIDSVQQASGACSQLTHMSGNPAFFMATRECLDLMKEGCMTLAKFNGVIG